MVRAKCEIVKVTAIENKWSKSRPVGKKDGFFTSETKIQPPLIKLKVVGDSDKTFCCSTPFVNIKYRLYGNHTLIDWEMTIGQNFVKTN